MESESVFYEVAQLDTRIFEVCRNRQRRTKAEKAQKGEIKNMRINYEKALSVVTHSNPTMASEVQTCIDLLSRYATNAISKTPTIDYLQGVVVKEAEDVLATHYLEWSAQIEATI